MKEAERIGGQGPAAWDPLTMVPTAAVPVPQLAMAKEPDCDLVASTCSPRQDREKATVGNWRTLNQNLKLLAVVRR